MASRPSCRVSTAVTAVARNGFSALAGSLTAAFLGAQPASATNMNGVCEAGEFCAYYLTNFNGAIADMEFNEANFQGKTFANSSISRNDNIRSGKDRGRVYTPCLYTASNYSGSVVNTGQTVNEWSTFGSLNDTASSLRWTAGLWCA